MKVLVTGGAGYIGSHTTHQLIKAGHEVTVIDDFSTGYLWTLPKQVRLVRCSTGDSEQIRKTIQENKIEAVVHFAAFIRVEESVQLPLKYYQNNTLNSLILIRSCLEEGISKFVFSSTAAVYGLPKDLPVQEESPLIPINPYGSSKLMTEWILRDLAKSTERSSNPFRYIALRYFNVAGAQEEGQLGQLSANATHLIKVASEAACGLRKDVPIFGTDYPTRDGTCIRDYIHVDDLASAHLHALDYLNAGGKSETLNCGYGHGYSVREVLSVVREVSGVDFTVREADRRPGDPPALVADATRIQKVLGWKPRKDDLKLICKTAYEWEKKRKGLSPNEPNR